MDQYTATEEAYKNGFRDGCNSICHCRDCVYRWKSDEERTQQESDEHEMMCFKHQKYTRADYYCGDAATV